MKLRKRVTPVMTQSTPPLRSIFAPVRALFVSDASAGILLILVAAAAMLAANSPLAGEYRELFYGDLSWTPIAKLDDLHLWINDGLMTLFFFVISLELKREIVLGELRNPRLAALPLPLPQGRGECGDHDGLRRGRARHPGRSGQAAWPSRPRRSSGPREPRGKRRFPYRQQSPSSLPS